MSRFKAEKIRSYIRKLLHGFRYILTGMGGIFLLAVILSFTDYPFWAYYWLGTHNTDLNITPQLIVIMGGGGMPSPDGLMRCYYGASVGSEYPSAKIIIAVPGDTNLHEDSPELLMARELILRGIDSSRIMYESEGHNTRTQALNISSMIGKQASDSIAVRIITSPEHMLRSVAAFRKIGFANVGGKPSFEKDIDEQLLIKKNVNRRERQLEERALGFRYNMWNYMKYEITVMREYCAIAYYKIRGWM
jgi:uncharacterized SAM-binding protein YcdF (DUF218 family)